MSDNGKIVRASASDTIIAEAASWIAQLDSDNMTNADRLALREWAARSPRHLEELKRLGGMWSDIDAVLQAELPENDVGSLFRIISAAARINPRPLFGAVVASISVMIVVFTMTSFFVRPAPPYEAVYHVHEGENKQFSLPDGSLVHLNTDSLVGVGFTTTARDIRLIRGEAHFEVVKDSSRPFRVYAGTSVVQALGTSFSVRFDAHDTSVLVTEGVVEFTSIPELFSSNDAQPAPIIDPNNTVLSAGQVAQLRRNTNQPELTVSQISEKKIDAKLAWRKGLIIFDGEPLTYVVSEISRYTPSNVIISDPEIRNMPIGGVFPAGEVDSLLGALETSFGVDITRVDQNTIYLSKREAG